MTTTSRCGSHDTGWTKMRVRLDKSERLERRQSNSASRMIMMFSQAVLPISVGRPVQ